MDRIRSADDALAFLALHGVMTLVPTASRKGMVGAPSLLFEIVREKVPGSWWAHPKGKLVFDIATALEDSGDVLVAKLVEARVTFVHRRLFPALAAVVTDDRFRKPRVAKLPADARRLLTRVDKEREVTGLDRSLGKAKSALEKSALVHARSEHTDRGHHATVLESWGNWAARARVKMKKSAPPFDDALLVLERAGLRF